MERALGSIAFVLAVLGEPSRAVADDLLVIQRSMQHNREAIRTIECKFEKSPLIKSSSKKDKLSNHPIRVHWRQTENTIRWDASVDFAGLTESHLWRDGLKKSLITQPGGGESRKIDSGSYQAVANVESDSKSPWLAAGFILPTAPMPRVCDFLADKKSEVSARRINHKGRNAIELAGMINGIKTIVVVDPARNYSVLKLTTMIPADGSFRTEREIVSLKEVGPGVFFPDKIDYRIFTRNAVSSSYRIVFTSIRVNEEIDSAQMVLKFPEGAVIVDKPANQVYKTDADEKPVPNSVKPIPLSKDEQNALEAQRPWFKRLGFWLWTCAGLLLLLFTLIAIRHRRKRSV